MKSDVTLLIMFLKKSSEMFRRTSIISVALYAQKLYYKVNKSKPRAKAYRKPFKKSFENIFYKVTGRTKSRKQNTDEKDIQKKQSDQFCKVEVFRNYFYKLVFKNYLGKINILKTSTSKLYPN